ncbi:MAG: hypothetical protein ABIH59_03390 [archaeon]
MQTIKNVRGSEPVHFDKIQPTKPLPQPPPIKTTAHIPPTDINKVPQKKSVFVMWILSTMTLGIYPAIWYMKKAPQFQNLGTQKKLSKTLPFILLILSILLITLILIFPLTITTEIENMSKIYPQFTALQTGLLFAIGVIMLIKMFFSLLIAFYSRTIINQAFESKGTTKKISALFTLIFTHLYLQYEINRILEDKEENLRKAPWIFFILIIILIILGSLSSYI